ncbi:hypothetical protein EVAR_46357_1 [Eumeta japonica]|uniref:Uncharacterized protein n=1 Tax=Eumeta variegata TaxID=151549 RepID=A0A4C1WUR3_EUMVA|nr:hypothetical protein EVAR_46357_1 [Eumeta japonica]
MEFATAGKVVKAFGLSTTRSVFGDPSALASRTLHECSSIVRAREIAVSRPNNTLSGLAPFGPAVSAPLRADGCSRQNVHDRYRLAVVPAFSVDIVTKALRDMGYQCPDTDWILDRFVRTVTQASSRASSSATSPASSQASSHSSTRSSSPSKGNKKRASSSSEEETSSDSTVVGSGSCSDNESDSGKSATGKVNASQPESFTIVKGKNKKAIRKTLKKSKTSDVSPSNEMDVDVSRPASATNNVMVSSLPTYSLSITPSQTSNKTPSVAGTKPTIHQGLQSLPLFFCAKTQTF